MARSRSSKNASGSTGIESGGSEAREPLAVYGSAKRGTRQERLELRIDADSKSLIEEAAALEGRSTSAFMLSVSLSHARRVVEAHRITTVTGQDWSVVQGMLENPPAPTTGLRKAAAAYRKRIVRSDGL